MTYTLCFFILQPIDPESGTVVVGGFPRQRDHESRYMALGPDGQLYVSFGKDFLETLCAA